MRRSLSQERTLPPSSKTGRASWRVSRRRPEAAAPAEEAQARGQRGHPQVHTHAITSSSSSSSSCYLPDSSSSKSGAVSAEPARTKKARTWGAPTTTASADLDHSSAVAATTAGAGEEVYSSDHVERVAIQQYESEYETSSEDEVDDVKQRFDDDATVVGLPPLS